MVKDMEKDLMEIEDTYVAPTYGKRGISLVRGDGVHLYDEAGKEYIDCFSNVGVNILGYNNRRVNEAIVSQLSKITNVHQSFYNDVRAEFSRRMIEVSPKHLTRLFYSNSGTEAVEAAIKFSRVATGRKEIIAARMGYHGKTMGSLSLTRTDPKYQDAFKPLLSDVNHFTYDSADSLREVISDRTAAVILEPIQGEGGIRVPSQDFFRQIRKICDDVGALLIIDEVQTGMGRTGKMFAHEHFDVKCDIMCLAKGIANGVPIGLTLITEDISGKLFKGAHTNTFGGNPLACAAGIAVLDEIEERGLLAKAKENGDYFIRRIREVDSPMVREVRGMGLMIGIELKTKATLTIKGLQDEGVIVFPSGSTVIRLLPPLTISREDIDKVVERYRKVLNMQKQ